MTEAAVLFFGVLILGLVTCRRALGLVRRLAIIDTPNVRSSHEVPTPRGGGIGILAALIPGAAVGAFLLPPEGIGILPVLVLFAAVAVLAALGYLDDRKGAGPGGKMVLQLAAGVSVVMTIGGISSVTLPGLGTMEFGWAGPVLTVFWLVGFSNGFNFMDGIDGISALHAGIAGLLFAGATFVTGGSPWLAVPVAAASLAFLTVNWSPAKVFMGDVGSLPLGFLLAVLAVTGFADGVPFATSFLFLGPFLFDTIVTILLRAYRKENLLSAHRSHLYQRLVISGWSHARVTLLYGGWTLLTGALGFLYLASGPAWRGAALGGALLTGVGMIGLVHRRERNREGS